MGTPVTFISSNGPIPMPNDFFAASSIVAVLGGALFEHAHRLGQPRQEEPVDDEAVRIARGDRSLAEGLLQPPRAPMRGRIGRLARDDLDEPVLRRVIEVVQPHDALGPRRRAGKIGDRVRRGVGRENRVRAANLVEAAEDALLDRRGPRRRLRRRDRRRPRSSKRDVPAMRSRIAATSGGEKMPRCTPSFNVFSMMLRPRATLSSSRSTSMTLNPSVAIFWAMPLPMLPAPTTARRSNGRSAWCE